MRTRLVLEVEYWNLRRDARLGVTFHLYNESGTLVFESGSDGDRPLPAGLFRETCVIPGDLLNDGRYLVNVLLVRDQATVVYRLDDAVVFSVDDVVDLRGAFYGEWQGVVRPRLVWNNELLERLPGAHQPERARPFAP